MSIPRVVTLQLGENGLIQVLALAESGNINDHAHTVFCGTPYEFGVFAWCRGNEFEWVDSSEYLMQ